MVVVEQEEEQEEELEQEDTLAAGVNAEVLETAAGGAGYLSVRATDIVSVLHTKAGYSPRAAIARKGGWTGSTSRPCHGRPRTGRA